MLAPDMGATGKLSVDFPAFGFLSGVFGYRTCDTGPWCLKEMVHCPDQGTTWWATLPDSR